MLRNYLCMYCIVHVVLYGWMETIGTQRQTSGRDISYTFVCYKSTIHVTYNNRPFEQKVSRGPQCAALPFPRFLLINNEFVHLPSEWWIWMKWSSTASLKIIASSFRNPQFCYLAEKWNGPLSEPVLFCCCEFSSKLDPSWMVFLLLLLYSLE